MSDAQHNHTNEHESHEQDANCLFCKIASGTIPSRKVYEDEELFAFHDISPWAPVHFLIIPKQHVISLAHTSEKHAQLLGKIMTLAPKLALEQGCRPYPEGGFRVVVNTGADGGQEIQHLHVHVLGGARPWLKG